jgi:hypothetical protein
MDMASLEHRSCAPENEIDPTLDVAIREIRSFAIDPERVLPTEEPAVTKDLFVAHRPHRDSWCDRTRGVFERYVLGREIVRLDHHTFAAVETKFVSRRFRIVHPNIAVKSEERSADLFVLAPKGDEGFPLVNQQALPVRAGFDHDEPPFRVVVRDGVDRCLDGFELSASIRRDDNRSGLRVKRDRTKRP